MVLLLCGVPSKKPSLYFLFHSSTHSSPASTMIVISLVRLNRRDINQVCKILLGIRLANRYVVDS